MFVNELHSKIRFFLFYFSFAMHCLYIEGETSLLFVCTHAVSAPSAFRSCTFRVALDVILFWFLNNAGFCKQSGSVLFICA